MCRARPADDAILDEAGWQPLPAVFTMTRADEAGAEDEEDDDDVDGVVPPAWSRAVDDEVPQWTADAPSAKEEDEEDDDEEEDLRDANDLRLREVRHRRFDFDVRKPRP